MGGYESFVVAVRRYELTGTVTDRNPPAAAAGRSRRTRRLLPPGMTRRILRATPQRLRSDVLQEAWLAFLMRRNPDTAARNYLHRQRREEANHAAASQLSPDMQAEFQNKCY